MDARLQADSISLIQAKFLRHLVAHPKGITLAEWALLAHCTRANVTQMMSRLEGLGFVRRAPNPQDRRSSIALATPAGKRAFERAEKAVQQFEAEVVSLVGKRNAESLWDTLVKLQKAFE